jgi:hypothetical protein
VKPRPIHAAAAVAALLGVPAAVIAQQTDDYVLPAAPAPASGGAPLPPLEPKPAVRRAVVARTISGRVTYRMPGEERDRALPDAPTSLPMKTVIDATAGRLRLTVARQTRSDRTDSGTFFDGRFSVSQGAGKKPITHLRLVGEIPTCASGATARAAATKKRRRLWGDGKGRFRTRGRYSAATVRGTKWLVEDRCDGTLTRVARGVVDVVDYAPVGRGQQPPPPAAAPEQGGGQAPAVGGPPAPQFTPGATGDRAPRRVRVRSGGTYVARPG